MSSGQQACRFPRWVSDVGTGNYKWILAITKGVLTRPVHVWSGALSDCHGRLHIWILHPQKITPVGYMGEHSNVTDTS